MKRIIITLITFSFSLVCAEPKEVNAKFLQIRGKVGSQLTYIPNQDSPFTGKAFEIHPQKGHKTKETHYKEGKMVLQQTWHENGQLSMKGSWEDGKKVGIWNYWHGNGEKSYEGNFKEGTNEGIVTRWYTDGQKAWELDFKDGLLMSAKVWKTDGEKCPNTTLKNGNGIFVEYHLNPALNGKERIRRTYRNGQEVKD